MKKISKTTIQEWVNTFHEQGYIVLPDMLSEAECEQLQSDFDALKIPPSPDGIQFGKRMFEHSAANIALFAHQPMLPFAEKLIGDANGDGIDPKSGILNANVVHVIHNNSFKVPPQNKGIINNAWHQDDTPHVLSLNGEPLTNIRLNVLAFTVNYYLTDVLSVENGPTQVIPKSHLLGQLCTNARAAQHADKIVSCLGRRGTAVCFNNQIWHRGSPNTSLQARYITQITYAKRFIGHKYEPFMNYVMPAHCYANADERLKQLLGFLPTGAYG
jgi:ectoine hydroxylase-related dioxygenase (phytanoyl-CoA dioxygenase family)